MAKFILSISDDSYEQLSEEAKDRGVKVQLLIRAVIIPDWVRLNLPSKATPSNHIESRKDKTVSITPTQPSYLLKPMQVLTTSQKYEPVFVRGPRR